VAAYPRPGAVLTQIVMQYIKEQQKQTGEKIIDARRLNAFVVDLLK
jgi:hypothetical protein